MKKIMFISLYLFLFLSLCACHKESKVQTTVHDSTAVLLKSDEKGSSYTIIATLGHLISDCGGRCVYFNGRW